MAFLEKFREYYTIRIGPFRLEWRRIITRYEGDTTDPAISGPATTHGTPRIAPNPRPIP